MKHYNFIIGGNLVFEKAENLEQAEQLAALIIKQLQEE